MNSFSKSLATVAAIALSALAAPTAGATKLTLDGYGYYEFQSRPRYFGRQGVEQTGRYQYLGRGYYHRTELGMDYLTNRSSRRSGDMSVEFWAMPYYGATTGTVLMCELKSALGAWESYEDLEARDFSLYLDKRRFPEISLWEYTRRGWKFRDVLTFTRKNRL